MYMYVYIYIYIYICNIYMYIYTYVYIYMYITKNTTKLTNMKLYFHSAMSHFPQYCRMGDKILILK